MLNPIRRLLGLWKLAHQRLLHEPALAFALLLGWVVAVALVSAIPMYTDAIHQSLLRRELQTVQTGRRPVFAFFFHYTGEREDFPVWDHYWALDQYLETGLSSDLGLPVRVRMHYVKSDLFQLFPSEDGAYSRGDQPLSHVALGFITDLEPHLVLAEGREPQEGGTGRYLDVLISPALATDLGLQVGETYVLFDPGGISPSGSERSAITIPVRIAGVWQAHDPDAPFWYIPPESFDRVLLVSRDAYIRSVGGSIPQPLFDVGWYQVLDGGSVRAEDVEAFLRRVASVETRVDTLLPGTRLTLSPVSALRRYQRAVSTQSLLILLLSLPIVGLVLLFIVLIADNMVERQRLEISILKSRGSTGAQIVVTYLLQGITLGVLALLLGLPLGRWAAQAVGGTRGFLAFERSVPLVVAVTRESLTFAVGALVLALGATMAPAWRAAHFTIVIAKQAVGRSDDRPSWWQVLSDLALLSAAGYGYYLLRGQGRIALLQFGEGGDPWENPILFLAPAIFLLAGARVYVRLFPPAMRLLGILVARVPGVATLLAVRNLARSSRHYAALITLLVLTVGLGTFTASVARTLDENLVARTYYRVGADVALAEAAGVIGRSVSVISGGPSGAASDAGGLEELPSWAILPVSEHLRAPAVRAAARVGVFKATTRVGGEMVTGRLYGIDRLDFPRVAYFRRDFAPTSLGALMNALAVDPSGILVRSEFLSQTGLRIGDALHLRGLIAGSNQPLLFTIVGVVDLFPTAYPGEGEFFIANLEYIFDQLGGPVPYYVWLSVDQGVDAPTLVGQLEEVGFRILEMDDARQQIAEERARPERIGLFGFLSLGFVITTLLSMLALGLHAFLVYRQRFIQLGIMRAIGLSAGQVAASLAGEQILLTSLGILGGAVLGLVTSHLFIPFLQIGHTEADLIPPFAVIVAWRDTGYAVAALIAVSTLTTGVVVGLLSRLRVFQAVKLGEALT